MSTPTFEELYINTIRFLAVGMIPRANSSHSGTPMGTSAPGKTPHEKPGLTAQHMVDEARQLLHWRQP